jgi:hypothetical protein
VGKLPDESHVIYGTGHEQPPAVRTLNTAFKTTNGALLEVPIQYLLLASMALR